MRQVAALSTTQRWYLEAFRALTLHLKRPPSVLEFSRYVQKSKTPCYITLAAIADKGHLVRKGKGHWRRFTFPAVAK